MGRKTIGRFVDAAGQTFTAAGNILFSSTTVSTEAIGYDGAGGVQLKAPGTYMIYANFTGTATAATSALTVEMYEGNNSVNGASATGTGTAIGDNANLAFATVVSVRPNTSGVYATLYFKCAEAATISLANVIVEKVA